MQYSDFQELRKKIFANGKIDENDVALLRDVLLSDKTMTRRRKENKKRWKRKNNNILEVAPDTNLGIIQ